MFDYDGMTTYEDYEKQAEAVLRTYNKAYYNHYRNDPDLFHELVYQLMRADWKFRKDKGVNQCTYRIHCAKFLVRSLHNKSRFRKQSNGKLVDKACYIGLKSGSYLGNYAKHLANKELCELLDWGDISERNKEIFLLHYRDRLTFAEISRRMNFSHSRGDQIAKLVMKKLRSLNQHLAHLVD